MRNIKVVILSILMSSTILFSLLLYLVILLTSRKELEKWAAGDDEYKLNIANGVLGLGILLGVYFLVTLTGQSFVLFLIFNCLLAIGINSVFEKYTDKK